MEMVFYCGECNKFFYVDSCDENTASVCAHCGSEITINTQLTKEQYLGFNDDRKKQFKAGIRHKYPTKDAIIHYYRILQERQSREKLLGKLFTIKGSRGRTLIVCKNKCIIKTSVTVGSVVTGNATDGEKIIFYKDCTGLQFKESGLTIGYLQFETPSMQMNNMASNFFSENTFTFEVGTSGISNELMRDVLYYVMELIENQKYDKIVEQAPEFPSSLVAFLNN